MAVLPKRDLRGLRGPQEPWGILGDWGRWRQMGLGFAWMGLGSVRRLAVDWQWVDCCRVVQGGGWNLWYKRINAEDESSKKQ